MLIAKESNSFIYIGVVELYRWDNQPPSIKSIKAYSIGKFNDNAGINFIASRSCPENGYQWREPNNMLSTMIYNNTHGNDWRTKDVSIKHVCDVLNLDKEQLRLLLASI